MQVTITTSKAEFSRGTQYIRLYTNAAKSQAAQGLPFLNLENIITKRSNGGAWERSNAASVGTLKAAADTIIPYAPRMSLLLCAEPLDGKSGAREERTEGRCILSVQTRTVTGAPVGENYNRRQPPP